MGKVESFEARKCLKERLRGYLLLKLELRNEDMVLSYVYKQFLSFELLSKVFVHV